MTMPGASISSVEVRVLDFENKELMEEQICDYLLKGFTVEAITPSTWKTSEKPAAFSYFLTEVQGFTVILVKRDFIIKQNVGGVKELSSEISEDIKKKMQRQPNRQ